MASKKYDAFVKTGEYVDGQGETKARWLNVGAVLQTDKGFCMVLDRTFNPAGLPDPDGRGTVMINLKPPQPRDQQGGQQGQQQPQGQPAPGPRTPQPAGFDDTLDDDIPF